MFADREAQPGEAVPEAALALGLAAAMPLAADAALAHAVTLGDKG
jgi:hypothetical protein